MNKLLRFLLRFAIPMYAVDGGGGGGTAESLTTDSFASMLTGPGDNEQTEQSDSQNDGTEQETDQETAQASDEDTGTQDDAAETDADAEQAEQSDKDSADAFLELEIDGEQVKVSKDEAKNGYLRQHDYTQKTQALARERQESQAHVQQQFAQVTQFSQEIGKLTNIDAALQDYANVDWQTLRNDDPTAYAVHQAEFNNMRIQRNEVVAAIGQKQAQFTATQAQQFAQQTAEAEQHLKTVIPGFGKDHLAQMKDYGVKAGFTPQELAVVADKRMLEILYKASQYDKTQADAKRAVKTVAALPTKASKAAPVAKPAAQVQTEKLARRVAQTGNVRDFAALLGAAS